MTPEQEIIEDLLKQVSALRGSIPDTLAVIGSIPADLAAFEALSTVPRIGTTAMSKQFEQLEDSLASLFRAVLKALGQQLKGLYALDVGHHMVALGVLDDADTWLSVVKLRNQLVHEYSVAPARQLDRLRQAHAALPFLLDAAQRVETLIERRALLVRSAT